jgi:hypothetical protein
MEKVMEVEAQMTATPKERTSTGEKADAEIGSAAGIALSQR